jgi:hypothetical protein
MSLLARIEKLERETSGGGGPDHIVMFQHERGCDEDAEQDAALARYKAEHATRPGDVFGFIIWHTVHPGEVPTTRGPQ